MLHNQNFKRETRSQSVKPRIFLASDKRVFTTMRKSDMNKKEIAQKKSNNHEKTKNLRNLRSLSAQKTIELLSDSDQKEISKQLKTSSSSAKKLSKDENERLCIFLKEKINQVSSHKKSIINKQTKFSLLEDVNLYIFINEQEEDLQKNDEKLVEKILEAGILQKKPEKIKNRYFKIIKRLDRKSLREIHDHIEKNGFVGELYSKNDEIRIKFNSDELDKDKDNKKNKSEGVKNYKNLHQKEHDLSLNESKDISFNGSKRTDKNIKKHAKKDENEPNNPDSLSKFKSLSKRKFASDDSEASFTVCLNSDEKNEKEKTPMTSTNKIESKRKSYDSYHIATLKFNERNKRFLNGISPCPCKHTLKPLNNFEQLNKIIINYSQPEANKFDSDIYPIVSIEKDYEKASRQVICPEIENEMRDLKDLVEIVAFDTKKPKEEIIEILESVSGEAQDLVKALNEGNHLIRWTEIDDQVLKEANHLNLDGLKLLVKYKGKERVEKRIKFKNLKVDWKLWEI